MHVTFDVNSLQCRKKCRGPLVSDHSFRCKFLITALGIAEHLFLFVGLCSFAVGEDIYSTTATSAIPNTHQSDPRRDLICRNPPIY